MHRVIQGTVKITVANLNFEVFARFDWFLPHSRVLKLVGRECVKPIKKRARIQQVSFFAGTCYISVGSFFWETLLCWHWCGHMERKVSTLKTLWYVRMIALKMIKLNHTNQSPMIAANRSEKGLRLKPAGQETSTNQECASGMPALLATWNAREIELSHRRVQFWSPCSGRPNGSPVDLPGSSYCPTLNTGARHDRCEFERSDR